MKTAELTGSALNWAVCMALGRVDMKIDPDDGAMMAQEFFDYSTDWAQGGPIIEREEIAIDFDGVVWCASDNHKPIANFGPTPLIAAMRCYVASKLGDTVEVPIDLL